VTPIDLSPAHRRVERKRRRRLRVWAGVAGAFTAVALAGGTAAAAALSPSGQSDEAWTSRRDQLERAQARVEELRARIGRLETALRAERAARARPEWSLLLRFIAAESAGVAVLDDLTITLHPEAVGSEAYVVEIRGRAAGASAAATLALRLERSGVFSAVAIDAGNAGGDGARFAITARLGTPAPPPAENEGGAP